MEKLVKKLTRIETSYICRRLYLCHSHTPTWVGQHELPYCVCRVNEAQGPVQTLSFSWVEINSDLDRPKLSKVHLLIQTLKLICRTLFHLKKSTSKCQRFSFEVLVKYVTIIYAWSPVHQEFDVWIRPALLPNWPTGHVGLNSRVNPKNIWRALLIQTSISSCTKLGLLDSADEKFELGLSWLIDNQYRKK